MCDDVLLFTDEKAYGSPHGDDSLITCHRMSSPAEFHMYLTV